MIACSRCKPSKEQLPQQPMGMPGYGRARSHGASSSPLETCWRLLARLMRRTPRS
jgi:hypothetical protein